MHGQLAAVSETSQSLGLFSFEFSLNYEVTSIANEGLHGEEQYQFNKNMSLEEIEPRISYSLL